LIRSYDFEFNRAGPMVAFSNGFEGQVWEAAWCDSCQHQSSCVLLDVAVMGKTPWAWERAVWASLERRYICHEWTDKNAAPVAPQNLPLEQ
jgi:hypothetical protein